MRIFFVLIFLLTFTDSFAQQKFWLVSPYAIMIDTTTKIFQSFERGESNNNYVIKNRSTGEKLIDCMDGKVIVFYDTIVPGDIVQQGTTGIFKITPHTSLVNTTKFNVLIGNILIQFDNATHKVNRSPYNDTNYPIWLTNRSTGATVLTLQSSGTLIFDKLPASWATFGSGIKKIIVN